MSHPVKLLCYRTVPEGRWSTGFDVPSLRVAQPLEPAAPVRISTHAHERLVA